MRFRQVFNEDSAPGPRLSNPWVGCSSPPGRAASKDVASAPQNQEADRRVAGLPFLATQSTQMAMLKSVKRETGWM